MSKFPRKSDESDNASDEGLKNQSDIHSSNQLNE